MATGVIPNPLHMAIRTGLDMPPQAHGATGQQRPYRPTHRVRQRVAALVGRIPQLQDLLKRALVSTQEPSILTSASIYHALTLASPSPAYAGQSNGRGERGAAC